MPMVLRDRQQMQRAWRFGSTRLVAQAVNTQRDIRLFKVTLHVWPVIGIMKGSVRLVCAKMIQCVVCQAEQCLLDIIDLWNQQTVPNIPQFIDFSPALHVCRGDPFTEFISFVAALDCLQNGSICGYLEHCIDGMGAVRGWWDVVIFAGEGV